MDLVAGWSAWRAIGLLCCLHFVTFLHSGAINRLARCHGGYSFFLLVALGSVLQHATAGGVVLTLVRFFSGQAEYPGSNLVYGVWSEEFILAISLKQARWNISVHSPCSPSNCMFQSPIRQLVAVLLR